MNRETHKRTVTIGGEQIEAEFFELNFRPDTEEKYTLYGLWYDTTLLFYKLKHKTRDIYWKIRYSFQRMYKDYDNVDTFALCDKFIERYSKILKAYKKNMHCYPGTISKEEWDAIIDQMLFHLYYMDENNVDEELSKDVPENWIPCLGTSDQIIDKHKDEFFKLFSKYFYYLWN